MAEQATDATLESSTSTQTQQAESSPAQTQSGSGEQTLADIVTSTAAASLAEGTGAQDGSGTGSVPDGTKTEVTQAAKEESGQAAAPVKEPAAPVEDPDAKLPFHEHPRWKQVMSERNEFEARAKKYETEEAQRKPLVEAQLATNRYCQQNGITPAQYREVLEVQALINTNPQEAFKRLKPVYEQLAALNGQATGFDADVAERLRTAKIDEETAQEIMRLRAQSKFDQGRQRLTQEQQAAQNEVLIDQAVTEWDMTMRGKDTSFKPRANEQALKGKYELVADLYGKAYMQKRPTNTFEAIQMLNAAKAEADQYFSQFLPKPAPTGKTLPANGSSASSAPRVPKTLAEVVEMTASGEYKYER